MDDKDLVFAMEHDLFIIEPQCSEGAMYVIENNKYILNPKSFAKLKERYEKIKYERQFMAELEACLTPGT